ncbi:hypothetical protein [Streptomyces sp. G-G2]|uniref:hypothetical protein n=1 Tax=Streptomyces sp. G-G2 TaxID=3046201 RepID=UPI0024BA71F5|nr:hypothetical protein [Streptomyces sp. G-G2]MDJ0382013.1 hypothetical protein [Streptomyces sp. G-G2]
MLWWTYQNRSGASPSRGRGASPYGDLGGAAQDQGGVGDLDQRGVPQSRPGLHDGSAGEGVPQASQGAGAARGRLPVPQQGGGPVGRFPYGPYERQPGRPGPRAGGGRGQVLEPGQQGAGRQPGVGQGALPESGPGGPLRLRDLGGPQGLDGRRGAPRPGVGEEVGRLRPGGGAAGRFGGGGRGAVAVGRDGRVGQHVRLGEDEQQDPGDGAGQALVEGVRGVRREAGQDVEQLEPGGGSRWAGSGRRTEGQAEADDQHAEHGGQGPYGEQAAHDHQQAGGGEDPDEDRGPLASGAGDPGQPGQGHGGEERVGGGGGLVEPVQEQVEAGAGREGDPDGPSCGGRPGAGARSEFHEAAHPPRVPPRPRCDTSSRARCQRPPGPGPS